MCVGLRVTAHDYLLWVSLKIKMLQPGMEVAFIISVPPRTNKTD
jgi:hypothetical protein